MLRVPKKGILYLNSIVSSSIKTYTSLILEAVLTISLRNTHGHLAASKKILNFSLSNLKSGFEWYTPERLKPDLPSPALGGGVQRLLKDASL